ncbi:MAG TPA: hypothetical protein VF066_09530 [Thermoleophilaceae bacterium]
MAARDGSRFSAAAAAQRKVRLSLAPRLRRELRAHRRVRAVAAVVVNGRTAGERTIALVRR